VSFDAHFPSRKILAWALGLQDIRQRMPRTTYFRVRHPTSWQCRHPDWTKCKLVSVRFDFQVKYIRCLCLDQYEADTISKVLGGHRKISMQCTLKKMYFGIFMHSRISLQCRSTAGCFSLRVWEALLLCAIMRLSTRSSTLEPSLTTDYQNPRKRRRAFLRVSTLPCICVHASKTVPITV